MSQTTHPPPRKRVPNSVNSIRPIALRITTAELQRVKERADREQRSMAIVCRLAVLRERTFGHGVVEANQAIAHQGQRSGGEHRFREAPPGQRRIVVRFLRQG